MSLTWRYPGLRARPITVYWVSIAERVRITESSSRDGLQSLGAFVPTEAKSGLINDLAATGIRDFDAVSFVSPKWVPQMADGAEVISGVTATDITLSALVPNAEGLERALAAGVTSIGVLHLQRAQHQRDCRRVDASDSPHPDGDTGRCVGSWLCLHSHPLPL